MSIGFVKFFQEFSLLFLMCILFYLFGHRAPIYYNEGNKTRQNSPRGGFRAGKSPLVSAVSTEKWEKDKNISRNVLTSNFFSAIIRTTKEVGDMTTQEIIKELMTKDNKTNARFASDLEISQAALWDRLNNTKRKDFSVSVLSKMVRLLGYKIQIVPLTKQKPDDGYEL